MGDTPPDTSLHKAQTSPDDELVEAIAQELANQYGDKWDAQDFTETMHGETPEEMRAGYREVAQSILPLLASREAAVLERAAKVARDYANKARRRAWVNGPDSAATAGDHIASQIRTLSKGETP